MRRGACSAGQVVIVEQSLVVDRRRDPVAAEVAVVQIIPGFDGGCVAERKVESGEVSTEVGDHH